MQDVQNSSCSLRSVSESKNCVNGHSFVAAIPIQKKSFKRKTHNCKQLVCMCELQCVGIRGGNNQHCIMN